MSHAALGLEPGASPDDVRRAYLALARQYHPDKNPDPAAAEKFKAVREAYAALSGETPDPAFAAFSAAAFSAATFSAAPFPPSAPPLTLDFAASLEEAYAGCSRELRVSWDAACPCLARGACPACAGSGVTLFRLAAFTVRASCPSCGGAGAAFAARPGCPTCAGRGTSRATETFAVAVPPGAEDGATFPLACAGGRRAVARLKIAPHAAFARDGPNLRTRARVPLVQALAGFTIVVRHLDGRDVVVEGADVLAPGAVLAVPGEGIPRGCGRLEIEVAVDFPPALDDAARAALAAALPGPHRPALPAEFTFYTNPVRLP